MVVSYGGTHKTIEFENLIVTGASGAGGYTDQYAFNTGFSRIYNVSTLLCGGISWSAGTRTYSTTVKIEKSSFVGHASVTSRGIDFGASLGGFVNGLTIEDVYIDNFAYGLYYAGPSSATLMNINIKNTVVEDCSTRGIYINNGMYVNLDGVTYRGGARGAGEYGVHLQGIR